MPVDASVDESEPEFSLITGGFVPSKETSQLDEGMPDAVVNLYNQ